MQVLADVYANWVPREQIITTNLWSSELSKLVCVCVCVCVCLSVYACVCMCVKEESEREQMITN